jgi:hypothetical protein
LGWGTGDEWNKLYVYFDKAWHYVLDNLKMQRAGGQSPSEK